MRQGIINLLRWANIGLILVTCLAYLSPFVDPRTFWPFSILGLIFPVLFLLHMGFIFGWLFLKKWYFALSIACLLLGYRSVANLIQFNTPQSSNQHIRIFTNNILSGHYIGGTHGKNETASQYLAEYIRQQEASIVCLQECLASEKEINRLATLLAPDYQTYHVRNTRLFIASKYPIVNKGDIGFLNNVNGCIFVDVEIAEQKVRVYNVHLLTNRVTDLADKVAQEGDLQEKETWVNVRGIFGGYKRAAQGRVAQAEQIRQHIAQSPYPVIVCGDFNDVPQSFSYRLLSDNLQDSFRAKGSGLGTTFAGNLPMLRIDYILSSPSFTIFSHRVPRSDRSDHYPVIAEMELK